MRFSIHRRLLIPAMAAVTLALLPRASNAQSVCTAANVAARDSGCAAGQQICRITTSLPVDDGCTLDFGTRDLLVTPSGKLIVRTGTVMILAATLTINSGGIIDGRGTEATDMGGTVRIAVTGAVNIQGPNGAIDVSADDGGGTIMIETDGLIAMNGKLRAVGNIRSGAGGNIILRAEGAITTVSSSQAAATGARSGGIGGLIDFTARGRVDLGALLDVDGSDGGEVNLYSAADMIVRAIDARGTSDAGSGGCVGIEADASLQTLDVISLDGTGSSQGSGGGCGGFVCLEAHYGDLTVGENITAEGAIPDGGGGSVGMIADAGAIVLQPDKLVSVRGNGKQGCGGEICVDSKKTLNMRAFFDGSGGLAGGDVDISSGKDVTVAAGIDVSGRSVGSCGGTMLLEAGFEAVGSVLLTNTINVGSGGCGTDVGCGIGGLAQLMGCRVSSTTTGSVNAEAGQGGQIELIARSQLQLQGLFSSVTVATGPDAKNGGNVFHYPAGTTPSVGAMVRPPATLDPLGACTPERGLDCLVPCPVCGNHVVEFPETCDDGGGASPVSCDGCSLDCKVEDCNDGLNCTIDSCQPDLGCRHAPVELPATPCYEPSEATPTSTRTAIPTGSATTLGTATRTPTVPPPTRTPTVPTSPTVSSCVGDCNHNGHVAVNELVLGVNILLGSHQLSECPSFDRNASNTVTVDELVAAVRIALSDICQ